MSRETPKWLPLTAISGDGEMDHEARFQTDKKVLLMAADDCEIHPIADCSCNSSCRVPSECAEIADYIRVAVNSHAALVEACKLLLKYHDGDDQNSIQMMNDYADAVDSARAALRSAGEE